jgi:precorrin-6x reductase
LLLLAGVGEAVDVAGVAAPASPAALVVAAAFGVAAPAAFFVVVLSSSPDENHELVEIMNRQKIKLG